MTVYDSNPAAVARRFAKATDRLHVVDLDGARVGGLVQQDSVRAIAEAFGGALQVGGGVRTREGFETYLSFGAKRVVLGTAAIRDPELVRACARAHPGVVVLAVDAKDGKVATDGWTEVSTTSAIDLVHALADLPIAAVLYTDVALDGTGRGPNVPATRALAEESPFPVIASGGIATTAHIEALAAIPNVESAIVGRALYDGALSIENAVAAARAPK